MIVVTGGVSLLVGVLAGCSSDESSAPSSSAKDETVTVTSIVDGDTFYAGKRKVRVLGIDSCEGSTEGGEVATMAAKRLLLGKQVTLNSEPDVGEDSFGRELRYVTMSDDRDFGEVMVARTHTGLYRNGDSDASASYVAQLRTADPNGRTCEEAEPAPVTATTRALEAADDDYIRSYVPAPDPEPVQAPARRRSGQSGHPCLPGEKDGDGDGYCGEGR